MKIAFISFEYPPDTADGGIATYVYQAAAMLQSRGHTVEVFAGSRTRSGTEIQLDGVIVHRVQMGPRIEDREEFSKVIASLFVDRHREVDFDVLEGPDYGADAAATLKLVPDIPLVIKLHTPHFIFRLLREADTDLVSQLRERLGALRRRTHSYRLEALEHAHALDADEIAAPSRAIATKLIRYWHLEPTKVHLFPLPYNPSPELLRIPIESKSNIITFIGRLEARKGVLDLASAIPLILKQCPDVKFCFVGRSGNSPNPQQDMRVYLEKRLNSYLGSIEFTGALPIDQIPSVLGDTDICVFPSLWDSFGIVCLEAMAAGRGVVGSTAGGMAEIIDSNKYGKVVPPKNPKAIAKAVIELVRNPDLRMKLGAAARNRVLTEYNVERVASLQEKSYFRAIEYRHKLGARPA